MKTIGKIHDLAMLGLLVLAGANSGCIIESSSPPPPPVCADGAIRASWTLTAGGAPVECATGDEVDVNVSNSSVGNLSSTFDCFAHVLTTDPLPGGLTYNLSLGLFNAAGASISQTQTMPLLVHCGATEDIGDVEFAVN